MTCVWMNVPQFCDLKQLIILSISYLDRDESFNGNCCLILVALTFGAFVASKFAGGVLDTEKKKNQF